VASLRILSGPHAGALHRFESELVLGRAAEEVPVEDPEVSRRHVRLSVAAGGVKVEDLGSTNGTYVSERRIAEPTTITGSSIVRIGQTQFQLVAAERRSADERVSVFAPGGLREGSGTVVTRSTLVVPRHDEG
jgi:pSer/pThr/pTyr-binding forkhead associated (FHA) protein